MIEEKGRGLPFLLLLWEVNPLKSLKSTRSHLKKYETHFELDKVLRQQVVDLGYAHGASAKQGARVYVGNYICAT